MGIRSLIAVFAICFAGSAFAAVPPLPPLNFGVKSFGVLVLGEGEAPQWTETAQEISTAFTARFPVEFAYGLADKNSMQHAISRLEAQKVAKIVVVPLFFSSNAHVLKQVRYLFGKSIKPVFSFSLKRRISPCFAPNSAASCTQDRMNGFGSKV